MAVTLAANCVTTTTDDGPRVAAGSTAECHIVRETLSQLGDKWTLLVILCLSRGPQRCNALQRAIVGISHRMLTVTVRKLERDGLLTRTVFPDAAPRTEYALTPLGVSFTEPVMAVANWAINAQHDIAASRARFDM